MKHVLLYHAYRKDVRGRNVLHHVAKSGNMKCLKLLLEFGVDIHEKVSLLVSG